MLCEILQTDEVYYQGMTPLVCLIERIRRERTRTPEAHFTGALSALIQAGADPGSMSVALHVHILNVKNLGKILKGFGTTPLHRAVMMDKPEVVAYSFSHIAGTEC